MYKISLNGEYTLEFWDEQSPLSEVTQISAQVPGNVELDMQRAGILPDVLFGNNIKMLMQYEYYSWKYTRQFQVQLPTNGERIFLRFDGVDCIARYYLNGECIGHSENALVEHEFDVTDKVLEGTNLLEVLISSPILYAEKQEYGAYEWALHFNYASLRVRKAPHSYGWDITPRALSAGLWRDVSLVFEEQNEIKDVYLYTSRLRGNTAELHMVYDVQTNVRNRENLKLKVIGSLQGEKKFEHIHKLYFVKGHEKFTIENPQLWWPYGYGDATLYDVHVQLLHEEKCIAEHNMKFGVRTVELVNSAVSDSYGGDFYFKVNGEKIMCRGSNWVPADIFHSRDAARYEQMLELFSEVECNIIRCWGGNVYEDHAFFDYCDRHGIMVWQDFAMACAFYPQDEEFKKIMWEEASKVVKKLRNHPSIVLWAGDNECDVFMGSIARMDPNKNVINRVVLAEAVRRYAPCSEYLPSSPYLSPRAWEVLQTQKEEAPRDKWEEREVYKRVLTEDHPWLSRAYYKASEYEMVNAAFWSEIGTAGCNNISSLKTFLSEDKLWPWQNNEEWYTHVSAYDGPEGKYEWGIRVMRDDILEVFAEEPTELEEFVVASQIYHAEGMKHYVEQIRIQKWKKTGIIWWNLIDTWPQFSNALVSYDFTKKLAFHFVKQSMQKVLIALTDQYNFWTGIVVSNDTMRKQQGTYKVWEADSGIIRSQGEFDIEKNSASVIASFVSSSSEQKLLLIEWYTDGRRYVNHYVMGYPPYDLQKYKDWVRKIALHYDTFNFDEVGK